MTEVNTPKRAGKPVNKGRPDLEDTIKYTLILMHPDNLKPKPNGNLPSKRVALQMGWDTRRLQRHANHPDWILVRKIVSEHQAFRNRENTFGHYVFKHLSQEAREIWEDLQFHAEHKDGMEQIRLLMNRQSSKIRQELFVHALVSTNYDVSRSCQMTGLSRNTLDKWRNDARFAELLEEIQFHKKNFFEKAMMDLVHMRNPLAVIWANKTVNADRGYSEKVRVEHTVQGGDFSLEDLDLDIETRRKILEAIRKRQLQAKEVKALPPPTFELEEVGAEAD